MGRFMFEDDDRDRNLLGGTVIQQQLIYMTANEVWIHTGCAHCGARLVHNDRPYAGMRIVYPPGTNNQTAVGTPLCGNCLRKVRWN
jgi:hypothetical protein